MAGKSGDRMPVVHKGYQLIPEGKDRPGCDAETSPLLVPW